VLVRPNLNLFPALLQQEIPYDSTVPIRLNNAQASVDYIFEWEEIIDPATPPEVEVGQEINRASPPYDGHHNLLAGPFTDDAIFRIRVRKRFSGLEALLPTTFHLKVAPNTDLQVQPTLTEIFIGLDVDVTVSGTQTGVEYHLRDRATGAQVGSRRFDHFNVGIGTARIGDTFAVRNDFQHVQHFNTGIVLAPMILDVVALKRSNGMEATVNTPIEIQIRPGRPS
ncbi:MAG: hypothetical protein AAF570_17460, partial [Bacteroidota bacterium]